MDIILGFSIVISMFFLAYQKPSIGWIVVDELLRILFIIDILFTFF